MVWPSVGILSNSFIAICPLAPALFSIITGCFQICVSFSPSIRENISVDPPGGKGTINRIGFWGYDACAKPIFDKYQLNKEQQTQIQQQLLQNQQQQLRNATIQQEKTKNRNLYIGLGVLVVFIGVVVYFKRKS